MTEKKAPRKNRTALRVHSLKDPRQLEVLSEHLNKEDTRFFLQITSKEFEKSTKKFFIYKDKMYFLNLEEDKFYFYRATDLEFALFKDNMRHLSDPVVIAPKYDPGSLAEAYSIASTLSAEEGEKLIAEAKAKFGFLNVPVTYG